MYPNQKYYTQVMEDCVCIIKTKQLSYTFEQIINKKKKNNPTKPSIESGHINHILDACNTTLLIYKTC